MADVTMTVDGKKVVQPAGTLLIEACKSVGIEIPSFCYCYGLSPQAACRVVESHLLLRYEPDSGDRELFAEPREWNDPRMFAQAHNLSSRGLELRRPCEDMVRQPDFWYRTDLRQQAGALAIQASDILKLNAC